MVVAITTTALNLNLEEEEEGTAATTTTTTMVVEEEEVEQALDPHHQEVWTHTNTNTWRQEADLHQQECKAWVLEEEVGQL